MEFKSEPECVDEDEEDCVASVRAFLNLSSSPSNDKSLPSTEMS